MKKTVIAMMGIVLAASSYAEIILVNFTSGSGPNTGVTMDTTAYSAAAAPAAYTGSTWNDFTYVAGAHNNLNDSDGNATAIDVTISANSPAWSYEEGTLNPLDNYLYNIAGKTNTVSSLSANSLWDIYVFADDNNPSGGGTFTVNGQQLSSSGANNIGVWTENVNYVKFSNVNAGASGSIDIVMDGGVINGFQMVAVPEPATLGFVAIFGGGLLFIRRCFKI